MATNQNEGTADREYHDARGRKIYFQDDYADPIFAFIIGVVALLILIVGAIALVRWIG